MNRPATRKLFTPAEANRTLPLVRRIVRDILDRGQRLREPAHGGHAAARCRGQQPGAASGRAARAAVLLLWFLQEAGQSGVLVLPLPTTRKLLLSSPLLQL